MRRVQAGEIAWFEEIVRRHRPILLRVAASKLGQTAAAEDIVQETLLAAFAARASYRPEYSFRTWLWTILLNLCKRTYRREKTRSADPLSDEAATDLAAPVPGVLQELLSAERACVLQAALQDLPESQADTLRLRFFAGLTFEEIALAMDCSVSGAKRRAKLGLLQLAELLRSYEESVR